MMKILSRVLLILLATGLVIGATYAISLNSTLATAGGPGGGGLAAGSGLSEGGARVQNLPERPQGSQAQIPGGEFHGEREGAAAFGWAQVLKSLGVIGGVTGAVILIQKGIEFLRRTKKRMAKAPSAG